MYNISLLVLAGILMPGSINAGQLGNMTILPQQPNLATSSTPKQPIGIVTSSVVTSHTASANGNTGFITTALRNVAAPAQASVVQNATQSQPTTIQTQQVQ